MTKTRATTTATLTTTAEGYTLTTFADLCKTSADNLTAYRRPTTTDFLNAYRLENLDHYERPQKAVYCVLRAKIRDSGLKMYIDLQNGTRADQSTANEWQTLIKLEEAEQTAKHLEKVISNLEKVSKDIKATDEERTKALAEIPKQSKDLAKVKSTISALQEVLESQSTFTDRQDLLQVAYTQDHINRTTPAEITAEHLALIGKTEADRLTIDEWATLQVKANFSAICKAVNRYMDTLPTAQTMDKVKKKYIAQTKEQAEEWAEIYGGIGKEIKVHQPRKRTRVSECFATMEYFDTKSRKGFYKVMHYLTTAPVTYIEQYTNEEGQNTADNLIKYRAESHEPTAHNISTADTHTAILHEITRLNRKDLTKRQAEFLDTFLKLEAYGDKCKAYYIEHKKGAYTTAQAEKWAYKKRIEKTFDKMGIDNKETQRKTLYRLSQAIKPRATAKGKAEPKAEPRADLVKWAEQSHQAEQIADIIKWYTHEEAEQVKAEAKSRPQTEEQKALAEKYGVDNTTDRAKQNGHLAELRYIIQQATDKATAQRLTAEELEKLTARLTKHKAKADRKSKGKARAEAIARAEEERAKARAKAEQTKRADIYRAKDQAREDLNRQGFNIYEYNHFKAVQHFKKSAPLSALVFMGA